MLMLDPKIAVHLLFSGLFSFWHGKATIMNSLLLWCIHTVMYIYWFWSLLTILLFPSYYYHVDTYNVILYKAFDNVALYYKCPVILINIQRNSGIQEFSGWKYPWHGYSLANTAFEKSIFRDYFKQTRATDCIWRNIIHLLFQFVVALTHSETNLSENSSCQFLISKHHLVSQP